jgi:hypothetical protein
MCICIAPFSVNWEYFFEAILVTLLAGSDVDAGWAVEAVPEEEDQVWRDDHLQLTGTQWPRQVKTPTLKNMEQPLFRLTFSMFSLVAYLSIFLQFKGATDMGKISFININK